MNERQGDRHLNIPLGVSLAIVEVVMMVGISILVKFASTDLSTLTVLLFRYALCLPLLLAGAIWQRGREALLVGNYNSLAVRIVTGLISLSCLYAALGLMSLAKVTTLFQSITLFVTFLAPFMLGETVGWRRWAAVLAGFCGALILLNPGGDDWSTAGVLLGLAAPFFGAMMLINLRRLGQTENPLTTALWYNGAGALVFAVVFVWQDNSLPTDGAAFLMLVLIGVLSSFQQFFIAFSHGLAPASLLASFRYLAVPFSIIAGILFFDEHLSVEVIVGSTVIVAASIFILWREKALRASG
jgi:drug/metabolite transporter (DMT)-like permease